jgi:hypothetical protein
MRSSSGRRRERPRSRQVHAPRLVKPQLKVCNLSFNEFVRLALEYVSGEAAEGRRLALLILTLGAPVGCAVDDLVIASRVDQLQLVTPHSATSRKLEAAVLARFTDLVASVREGPSPLTADQRIDLKRPR